MSSSLRLTGKFSLSSHPDFDELVDYPVALTLKTQQLADQEPLAKEDLLYLSIVGDGSSQKVPLDWDETATEAAWWHVGHIPL